MDHAATADACLGDLCKRFEKKQNLLSAEIPLISVVLPSFQSACYIRAALRALVMQETAMSYEILVVDSSTDGTERIIEREFPQVRLLHLPRRCEVGTARNIGVEAARGEMILFVDTDTIPCPAWVERMGAAMRDAGADAVRGAMSNGTPWSVTGSAGFYLEFFRFVGHGGQPEPARFLVGGNSGFRREVLRGTQYGDRSVGEDMLFSSRLARQGRNLLFVPRASVQHRNKTGFRAVLSYQRKLGEGAFTYRWLDSPEKLRLLQSVPALIFLAPFAVMFWIAWSLLRRRCVQDFLRFVLILPLCWIGNTAWALGFYEALREEARGDSE